MADYESAEDDYFRARSADLADLRDRVLELLAGGADAASALAPGEGGIYVADDLAPSRFLEIDWQSYRGGALLGGSANSHVAILARARGVPLLIGLDLGAARLVSGAAAILDAEQGRLIQDPRIATRDAFEARMGQRRVEAEAEAAFLPRPAVTRAGRRIAVAINVDEPGIVDGVDPALATASA